MNIRIFFKKKITNSLLKANFFYSISLWVLKNPELNADFGSEGAGIHTGKKLDANKPFFSGDL
jgi:hypothetical protein